MGEKQLTRRRFGLGAAAAGTLVAAPRIIHRARAAGTTLRIGSLLPRSGFEAFIGQGDQRGVDLAKKILPGMGYAFEVIDADTESRPDTARTLAEKLIRDGAHILTGAFDSSQTFAIAQVAEQHGVPMVVNIGADPAITEQGYKYVFRNFPTSEMLSQHGLELQSVLFEATGKTPTTAVLMHVNDTFGQSMVKAVHAFNARTALPYKILDEIAYDPQARDLSAEVARAKAAKAELLLIVNRLNDAILLVREMVKQRYEPWGIISPGSPGLYDRQFARALGKYADDIMTASAWPDPKKKLAQTLRAAFAKDYPTENCGTDASFCFEAVLICADAFKRAQSTDADKLTQALRATDITERVNLGGAIRFDAHGQNTDLPSALLQIQQGIPVVVLPEANAEAKPVFPAPAWSARG